MSSDHGRPSTCLRRSTEDTNVEVMLKGTDNVNGNELRQTATLSPQAYGQRFLAPKIDTAGDLRKRFGNPTGVAMLGFIMAMTPWSIAVMNWRQARGDGTAAFNIPAYYWFGGLLLTLGGLGEWILGNTFPTIVFLSFGAFWLSYGSLLTPWFNAVAAYTKGADDPAFRNGYGFYLLAWAFLTLIFLVASTRTNVAFMVVFLGLTLAFGLLTGTQWQLARGDMDYGLRLLEGGGGCAFVSCCAGWWILISLVLSSTDFPLQIPLGDLSARVPGLSKLRERRETRTRGEA